MTLRRQLPVYSPITLRALAAGFRAAVTGDAASAEETVRTWIQRRFGTDHALFTDSGTSALALAIAGALKDQPRVPVALPAYSCYDVATAADTADVPVVLYDVDPKTLGPDFDSLRAALEHGARALVVAHLYGFPVDMSRVMELVREFDVPCIEDAAQGAGGRYQGRALGGFGSVAVLSFGRGKGTTGGGGGALLAHDEQGRAILDWALTRLRPGRRGIIEMIALGAQWLFGRPTLYWLPTALPFLRLGETIYRDPHAARDASLSCRAVLALTAGLDDVERTARRRAAGRLAAEVIEGAEPCLPTVVCGGDPGYLRLPVLCSRETHGASYAALVRLGILPAYARSLADLPGFDRRVSNAAQGFEGARTLARQLMTVPTHSRQSEPDLNGNASWLRGTL